MVEHEIQLVGGVEGENAIFVEDDRLDTCRVKCKYRGKEIVAEATDFFEALCQIRILLERDGLVPVCYGSSLNVYPSGMGRDMGGGLRAYRMTKGRHAGIGDLVEIFDTGPDVNPSTVEQQKRFFTEWLASDRT